MKRDNQLLSYIGVKTNNLKNINFSFKTNNITLIDGVSGSGKSSLAFDTIAAISKNQFSIMTGEGESFQNYILDSFSNTLPCIPLNQLNFNLNPRSTILSYFGLEHSLEYVLSEISHKNMSDFVPSFANECEMCKGLGIVYSFSLDKSIDSNCQISSNPFLFWHGVDNPFYKEILVSFCKEKNIDIHKKFYELSEKERDLLLYGSSTKRIRLVCSINGKKRVRTMSYLGAALFYNNQVGKLLSKKKDFSEISICPKCNGSRFSKRVGEIPLANGVTFSDILLMPFKNISTFFSHFISNKNPRLSESIKNISNFSDFATSIGLEYLNFSRSIPTLSGGELQRLRMIPLLTGKIGNLLIVLDEPSASLYPSETLELARKIKILSRNNTILMIDHNKNMQSISDESIYLGPGSGKNGGCIISKKEYEKSQNMLPKFDFIEGKNTGKICLRSNLVNMEGSIELRTSTIVGICGKNGVGKSTLLSTILNRILPKYELVTQRPIRGNSNSTVGTFSGLVDLIRNVFFQIF
jgi:excinuclease ABC subunit A